MPWDDSSAGGIQAHIDFLRNFLGSVSSASTTAKVNSEINSLMAVQQQGLQQQQLGFQNQLASRSMNMQAAAMAAQASIARQAMALQAQQAAAQMGLANKEFGAQQAQIAFQNKLITDQLARQHGYENQVKSAVAPYLQGAGIGYDPQELAAARAGFVDSVGTQFGQALANTKANIARRGGGIGPAGGMEGRAFAGLEAARASQQSQGIREILMANLEKALANKQWATSAIAGLGAGTVPNGYFGPGAAGAINVMKPDLVGTPNITVPGAMSAPNPFDPTPYLANQASLIHTMAGAQANSGWGSFAKGLLGTAAQGGIGMGLAGLGGVLFGGSGRGIGFPSNPGV